MVKRREAFELAGKRVTAGTQLGIKLAAAKLYTDTQLDIHVEVFHVPNLTNFTGLRRHSWG